MNNRQVSQYFRHPQDRHPAILEASCAVTCSTGRPKPQKHIDRNGKHTFQSPGLVVSSRVICRIPLLNILQLSPKILCNRSGFTAQEV